MRPKFRQAKSLLVTGGSSGIGLAIATEGVRRGASVVLVARQPAALKRAAEHLQTLNPDSRVAVQSTSVTDSDALAEAVRLAKQQHGPIDLLVNSAGVSIPGYFEELTIDDFTQQIEINYLGTVRAIHAVLPAMKAEGYGWIVNISSVAGFKGFFGYTAYCGSKFAVNGFSEGLRSELERHNVGVTLVCPPDTRTPMFNAEENRKPIETKRLSDSGTLLEPDEVAQATWNGLERSQFWVVPGRSAKLVRYANRYAPALVDWVIRRTIKG